MAKAKGTSQVLKLLLSLGLGVAIIYLIYRSLSPSDISSIKEHISLADYGWIALSVIIHILSHVSRAWRWKYTLEAIGIQPKFFNSFLSVMTGYLVNLAIPRLGEASRSGVLARYEKAPFDKVFGTVIAERAADLLMLILIGLTVGLLQFEILSELLTQDLNTEAHGTESAIQGDSILESFLAKLPSLQFLLTAFIVGMVLLGAGIWILNRSSHPIGLKIRKVVTGFLAGIQTVFSMEKKGLFILHTFIIWACYMLMFWVAMLSLDGTAHVAAPGVLAAFIMGSLGIVLVQGGLGAYPFLVMIALSVYGVDSNEGLAFGWINWTAQTLMIIFVGIIAFILLPQLNKN